MSRKKDRRRARLAEKKTCKPADPAVQQNSSLCRGCGEKLALKNTRFAPNMCRACRRFDQRARKVELSPPRYLCCGCYAEIKKGERICAKCRESSLPR